MRNCLALKPSLAVLAVLFAVGPGVKASLAQTSSTFDNDTEGWTVIGDATPAGVTWSPNDGNPGGAASFVDAVTNGVTRFVAPPKFLGNHSDSYGKTLKFDLKQVIGAPNQFANDNDVFLIGAGITLAYKTPVNPAFDGSWTSYTVPLTEAGWHVGSFGGAAATKAQMQGVLAAITGLRIRGEFQSGPDTDYLDNVILEGASLFTTIDNACGAELPSALFVTGTLEPLSAVSLTLLEGVPNAPTVLMLGVQPITAMREGCSLMFEPLILIPGVTNGNGSLKVAGLWPDNVPSGFTLYGQAYMLDASGPAGFVTSNTVIMHSP